MGYYHKILTKYVKGSNVFEIIVIIIDINSLSYYSIHSFSLSFNSYFPPSFSFASSFISRCLLSLPSLSNLFFKSINLYFSTYPFFPLFLSLSLHFYSLCGVNSIYLKYCNPRIFKRRNSYNCLVKCRYCDLNIFISV